MKKKSILRDAQFLIWILPILAFLTSIALDSGYLHYYGIPLFYAEVNYYTAFTSIFMLCILFTVFFLLLGFGFQLSESSNLIIRFLADRFAIVITIIYLIFGLVANIPAWPALLIWSIVIVAKIADLIPFIRNSDNFSEAIIKYNYAEEAGKVNHRESSETIYEKFYTYASLSFFIVIFSTLISMVGYYAAKHTQKWGLNAEQNTIVVPRNNGIYLIKNYNPTTFVLEDKIKVLHVDNAQLELKQLGNDLDFVTQSSIDEKENRKKLDSENAKKMDAFIKLVSGLLDSSTPDKWF